MLLISTEIPFKTIFVNGNLLRQSLELINTFTVNPVVV